MDAIHPGYGFLCENANFAEVCEASHLTFIGPPPEVIRLMGEKENARRKMQKAGVPILPGSEGVVADEADALAWARQDRFSGDRQGRRREAAGAGCASSAPKTKLPNPFQRGAERGGSGLRQRRRVHGEIHRAAAAHRVPGAGRPHGNVMLLGERECSIQRRHQKLLEESPSLQVTPELRRDIGERLVHTLAGIGYVNAGTVEFLMDEDRKLYFIEMNTRIQVEHPVTEMVTNIDLVKSQILIAAGERLENIIEGEVEARGHALECRINAEHPEKFTPSAGKITVFNIPGGTGVRVDTASYAEAVIPPYYDSLIAKLITRGRDRAEAISRMQRALEMFIVEGIHTSIPLHRRIMADADFRAGRFDTKYMERFLAAGGQAKG